MEGGREGVGPRTLALALALLATPAFAQSLPYHADPNAREILPSLTPVPAIRFLTTADFPPFNFRDASGELIGFNVDLAKRICAEVNVACTIQAWPWEQAASALADNQGDALIAGPRHVRGNGALFDFSSIYLALPGRFVTRAADIGVLRRRCLAGKTSPCASGSTHENFLTRYLPEVDAGALRQRDRRRSRRCEDGNAEAFFGDAMRASFWLNENLNCCGFAGEPYFRPQPVRRRSGCRGPRRP